MTTTVQFYHLLHTTTEVAIPKLVERALGAGHRVLIWCANDGEKARLSDALWSQNPASFLAHSDAESAQAPQSPIVLSLAENPSNSADILVITHGGIPANDAAYTKVLDVFDGMDDVATLAARQRWKHYKEAQRVLQYIKQQPGGGWKIEGEG